MGHDGPFASIMSMEHEATAPKVSDKCTCPPSLSTRLWERFDFYSYERDGIADAKGKNTLMGTFRIYSHGRDGTKVLKVVPLHLHTSTSPKIVHHNARRIRYAWVCM